MPAVAFAAVCLHVASVCAPRPRPANRHPQLHVPRPRMRNRRAHTLTDASNGCVMA
jgi:hypothetical protein